MKNKININGKDFTLEELNELIESSQKTTKEQRFLELFQGLQIRSDIEKYPNFVFYYRGDRCILGIENSILWVSYSKVWSIFEREFDMEYTDIQKFIQDMVEKHFKWKGLTPIKTYTSQGFMVEKHFKN